MAAHRESDEPEILSRNRTFSPGTVCGNALALGIPGDLLSSPEGILQLALSSGHALGNPVEARQEPDRTNLAIAALARLASPRIEISALGLLYVCGGNDVGWRN